VLEFAHFAGVVLRLLTATLGGLVGAVREWVGKAAGLRTHMLASLGAALFVLAPAEAGLGAGDTSRIIRGIAAGIGFIGAGTILKPSDRNEIQGLTVSLSLLRQPASCIRTRREPAGPFACGGPSRHPPAGR